MSALPAVKRSAGPAEDSVEEVVVETPAKSDAPESSGVSSSYSNTSLISSATAKAALELMYRVAKGTVLEAMAITVPKKDRDFFASRWGFVLAEPVELPADGRAEPGTVVRKGAQVAAEDPPAPAAEEVAAVTVVSEHLAPTAVAAAAEAHPVLGSLVADLSYKKTYATALADLVAVPIWRKQRILRPERAKKIAKSKLSQISAGKQAGLPGVITLYRDVATGQLGILDGQHRLGALIILSDQDAWDKNQHNITVDVFDTDGEDQVKDLFIEINKAEPLKLVDLPGSDADDELKRLLSAAVDMLAESYPDMFKASQRCRPPHCNKDNLRDDIYQSELMARHSICTSEGLVSHIAQVNATLAARPREEWTDLNSRVDPTKASFDDAHKKAAANEFFLGLDTTWTRL